MPDSANILSVLSALGGNMQPDQAPAPQNVLQSAAPPDAPYYAPPEAFAAPQPTVDAFTAPASLPTRPLDLPPLPEISAAPKRRSLLDTIGRVADVFAKVGGADALYQPTLDARQDRSIALDDHGRKVLKDNVDLATSQFALADSQNTRLGQVARGLKYIQKAGGDILTAWPQLAAQMRLDPDTIKTVGESLAADPKNLDGLIGYSTDAKTDQSKYGGSVVYGQDADGKLVAYQPSLSDDAARSVLPDGVTPIDPTKFVDTGGSQVGYGTRSGKVQRILPKSVTPDQKNRSRTAITIASMPARAQPGKTPATGGGDMRAATSLLDNIQRGFNDLHALQALPGEGSGAGMAAAAFGRTALGQHIGEQFGNAPAQKRLEIEKDINSLQSEMVKSLPASATRTKFEQEIQRRRMPDPARMSYATANQVIADLRRQFEQAQKDAAAELSAKGRTAPASRPAPKTGWSVVGVK